MAADGGGLSRSTHRPDVPARILIVEDDGAIRSLLVNVLGEEGYEAAEAGDGVHALEKIRENVPDLILLDLFMPRMDGWQFLERSRAVRGCESVPVIVLSAADHLPPDGR